MPACPEDSYTQQRPQETECTISHALLEQYKHIELTESVISNKRGGLRFFDRPGSLAEELTEPLLGPSIV